MKVINLATVMLAASGFLGCSAAQDDEDLGSVQQHFNASQCATAGTTQSFTSGWHYVSTTTYNTSCNALDVSSIDNANGSNRVFWSDSLPTNATDCTNSYVRGVLYDWSGSAWVLDTDTSSPGVWSGSSCSFAQINFGRLVPGLPYRIAATARTPSGSSFTAHQFSVSTSLIH